MPIVNGAPGGGAGGGAWTKLGVVGPLGAPQATISFNAIAQTFAHLMLIGMVRGDTALATTGCNVTVNGDSATNYSENTIQGTAATASSGADTGAVNFSLTMPAASATASLALSFDLFITAYTGLTFFKNLVANQYWPTQVATNFQTNQVRGAVWSHVVAALTSLTFTPGAGNFAAGSIISLYGLT